MDESMLMRDIWTKMIISAWIGRISICYPLPHIYLASYACITNIPLFHCIICGPGSGLY